MKGNDYFVAKTLHGLEALLTEELKAIGATDIQPGRRMASFRGDQQVLYKANLYLRTAIRVLVPIKEFTASNEDELYQGVRSIRWREYMRPHDTFAIDASVISKYFNHSHYVALKSKDAVVDQFRERTGERPSVDVKKPRFKIHLHIYEDQVTVYRDSSGDALYKRGYRQTSHSAPLNEVLAAGMIMLSGWKGDTPFVDPMCGSATLPIEAAMIARNQAPGLGRKFGFENWLDVNKQAWNEILEEAESSHTAVEVPIIAADQSLAAIGEARKSVSRAGLEPLITITRSTFSELVPPEDPGTLIMNPPYGERMEARDGEIEALYKSVGDQLKQQYSGWKAYMISSNVPALKKVGLRATTKLELFNGPLPCRFLGYELYKGSRQT